jgi:hypothetical protein
MTKKSTDHSSAAQYALRELWEVSDRVVREFGTTTPYGLTLKGDYEEGDPTIMRAGGSLIVFGEFQNHLNGIEVNEEFRVQFPEDLRDMLASEVTIDWYNTETQKSGINTVSRKEIPQVTGKLIELIELSYVPETAH